MPRTWWRFESFRLLQQLVNQGIVPAKYVYYVVSSSTVGIPDRHNTYVVRDCGKRSTILIMVDEYGNLVTTRTRPALDY